MRLHGEVVFSRSNVMKEAKHYSEYRQDLRRDFVFRCGYCSKIEKLTTTGFEIDHFVPQAIDKDRVCDYSNLVYSCFTCNRKKGAKWPTNSAEVCNDGIKGFVDPVSDEFDKHLGRSESGEIIYYSELGKYMAEDVFKFHFRPVKLIWKLNMLIEKRKILAKFITENNDYEKEDGLLLAEFCQQIDQLSEYIFEKRE